MRIKNDYFLYNSNGANFLWGQNRIFKCELDEMRVSELKYLCTTLQKRIVDAYTK